MTEVVPHPYCVLVSGPPGAGKSTLAQRLSDRLCVPLLSLDVVKSSIAQAMVERAPDGTLPSVGEQIAARGGPAGQRAFAATYAAADALLRGGASVILEKAWQRGRSEHDLLPLLDLAPAVQVHVTASYAVAVHRGVGRAARPGLVDMDEVRRMVDAGELDWESFGPLDLDIPLHVVDTTSGEQVELEHVARFVGQGAARGA